MKISELTPRMGNVELTAKVIEVGEPRTFNKFGKEGKVANAILEDESGTIKLSLWNEQADQVSAGDTVTIKNGYVNEWQGEMQLSTGKFGSLEVKKGGEEKMPEEEKKDGGDEPSFEEENLGE